MPQGDAGSSETMDTSMTMPDQRPQTLPQQQTMMCVAYLGYTQGSFSINRAKSFANFPDITQFSGSAICSVKRISHSLVAKNLGFLLLLCKLGAEV